MLDNSYILNELESLDFNSTPAQRVARSQTIYLNCLKKTRSRRFLDEHPVLARLRKFVNSMYGLRSNGIERVKATRGRCPEAAASGHEA